MLGTVELELASIVSGWCLLQVLLQQMLEEVALGLCWPVWIGLAVLLTVATDEDGPVTVALDGSRQGVVGVAQTASGR